jgi:Spy/CpxP family protein refolding chaperone
MKRFRSFPLTATLAALLTAGVVYAQAPDRPDGPRGRGPGRFGGPGPGLPLAQLNLSEQQQEQFRTLREQYREQARTAEERLNAARTAQRKAVETIPVNEAVIRSATQELVEAQTEAAIHQARLRSEIFALLTPDQQAQATKLIAERAARGQQRRPRQQKESLN